MIGLPLYATGSKNLTQYVVLPACRRLLFPLLHAEKGPRAKKGNRRRLHAGNMLYSPKKKRYSITGTIIQHPYLPTMATFFCLQGGHCGEVQLYLYLFLFQFFLSQIQTQVETTEDQNDHENPPRRRVSTCTNSSGDSGKLYIICR